MCVSVSVIRCISNTLGLKCVCRRGQTEKERKKGDNRRNVKKCACPIRIVMFSIGKPYSGNVGVRNSWYPGLIIDRTIAMRLISTSVGPTV